MIKFSKFNWIFFVRILIKTTVYNASYKWQKELDCVTKRKTPTLVTLDELYKTIISKWPIILLKNQKMTYQQFYETLQSELKEKTDIYLKLEKELCQIKRWSDLGDLRDYNKAKNEWQTVSNNYWNFLSDINIKAVNPDDEVYFGLKN